MREIWFRGKTESGIWQFGCYSCTFDMGTLEWKHYIETQRGEKFVVIPETVGQLLGRTDKRGTKIFEGDIVEDCDSNTYVVKYGEFYPKGYACSSFQDSKNKIFGFYLECKGKQFVIPARPNVKVIGNIHNNPELIHSKGD